MALRRPRALFERGKHPRHRRHPLGLRLQPSPRAGISSPCGATRKSTDACAASSTATGRSAWIWLGDSLHTPAAAEFAESFLDQLGPLEVIVIKGNHDRAWPRANHREYRLGKLVFHHGDAACELAPGEIELIGHIHPAMSWSDGAGLRVKVPALIHGPRRIVLPSFSDWSAGAPWNNRLEQNETLWLVAPRRVWPLPASAQ